MLLRDSEVAKVVRTQLLNIEEKASDETKTQDIDEEQSLMLSVGMAVASGDATAVAVASAKLVEFKNRHIQKLENDCLLQHFCWRLLIRFTHCAKCFHYIIPLRFFYPLYVRRSTSLFYTNSILILKVLI